VLVRFGTYAGTGSALAITGLAFSPDVVLIKGGANIAVLRTSTMGADSAKPLNGATALSTVRITSIDADGFSVGAASEVNTNTDTIHYIALKNQTAAFEVFSFTGNGSDDRNVTTASFGPDGAVLKVNSSTVTTTAGAARFKDEVGDLSFQLDATDAAADKIQSFLSNGLQVGTHASVNENTKPVYGLLFKTFIGGTAKDALMMGVG
jgi:hypothetical protein